jgi:hypothetical protein
MYIDGVEISQWPYAEKSFDLLLMRIGKALSGTSRVFKGAIDEFRLYNEALDAVAIEELYNYDPATASVSNINGNEMELLISPNPFNDIATISYKLQNSSNVQLRMEALMQVYG